MENIIKWKTYGTVPTVNVDFAIIGNPSDADWIEIASEEENVDSLFWTTSMSSDSVHIRIRDPDSFNNQTEKYKTEDISGWYFSVSSGRAAKIAAVRAGGKGFNK